MKMDMDNLENTFFTLADSMIPLPTPSFIPLNYNQLHPSFLPVPDSTHHLFHFFSKPSHHLPPFNNLSSTSSSSSSSSSRKRPRFDSSVCPNHEFLPPVQPQNELARQRRQNISDKVRCLQKLMPCEKKMDTATTLEEAYKYVRFLQAQVKAVQTMPPIESSFSLQNYLDGYHFGGPSGLEMLNRQQLLQVFINSSVAQTMLYSKGFCVFSLEQLILMNKLGQAKLFMQQQQQHHR